jgi:hypothetical protein
MAATLSARERLVKSAATLLCSDDAGRDVTSVPCTDTVQLAATSHRNLK